MKCDICANFATKAYFQTLLTSTMHVPHLCFPLQFVHLVSDRYTFTPLPTRSCLKLVPPDSY